MKRFLIALSLITALLFTTGCGDTNIVVFAHADLITPGMDIVQTETLNFGPYSNYTLSNHEIEEIFNTLIKGTRVEFTSASLFLEYHDVITGQPLRSEEYGVVLEANGRYSFVLMTY
jgi:hypothetical protein